MLIQWYCEPLLITVFGDDSKALVHGEYRAFRHLFLVGCLAISCGFQELASSRTTMWIKQ